MSLRFRVERGLGFVRRLFRRQPVAARNRDYVRDWISPDGLPYRVRTYERQRKGGTRPLLSNPTTAEIVAAFAAHQAHSVLEVGCGWGRLLAELAEHEYDLHGCDVSEHMLGLCPPGLQVFLHDIAVEDDRFVAANAGRWDVVFTRGVMLYFVEAPNEMAQAMRNMEALAARKVIVWEWPEVCEQMARTWPSRKFEYHVSEHRDE
jgi:2-polyprenyl-3-methyl-5-hydroxy-6-metoxy-1,4-benzoquinol methylase